MNYVEYNDVETTNSTCSMGNWSWPLTYQLSGVAGEENKWGHVPWGAVFQDAVTHLI